MKTIDNYDNYKFELVHQPLNQKEYNIALKFLQKCISQNHVYFFDQMGEYVNTNKVVPYELWRKIILKRMSSSGESLKS